MPGPDIEERVYALEMFMMNTRETLATICQQVKTLTWVMTTVGVATIGCLIKLILGG